MRRFPATAVLIVGLLLTAAQGAFAQNLFSNPGFETGSFSGWTGMWNYGEPPNFENHWGINAFNFAGSFSAANNRDGGYQQSVSIAAGQSYQFSCAVYVTSGGDPSGWGTFVNFDFLNSAGSPVGSSLHLAPHLSPRDQWHVFGGTLTAPGTATQARVQIGNFANTGVEPGAPVFFDSFSLVAIPEASTLSLGLLGIAAVALFAFNRVSKKSV